MEIGQQYDIKFSKAGFAEKARNINTGRGEDKSILDITSLISSSTSIPVPSDKPSSTTTTDDKLPPVIVSVDETTITKTEKPSETETPLPPVIKSQPDEPATKPSTSKTSSGYSVQLAALSLDKKANLDRYAKARKIGEIYVKKGSKYQQVRLGVFKTKSEAQAAQKQLAKIGHASAYVVAEKSANAPILSAPKVPETPASSTTTKTDTKPTNTALMYYVRLGAFRNPKSFDDKGLKIYGDFKQQAKGEFTIMYLEAGSKIGRARVIREKARELGFDGAYVVVKKNGKYVKA